MHSSMARLLVPLILAAAMPLQAGEAQQAHESSITVFAAASLTDVLENLAATFTKVTGTKVTLSFAASSALARQIEAGAQVDVFVSADEAWMDYLATRRLIEPASRRDIARNALVLIAPADSRVQLAIAPGFDLRAALGDGRLAIADPATVPAGRYAQAALTDLGAWASVADRLANADNVRAALAFVARGEAPLGIVYATDALIEKNVKVVGVFPAGTYPTITYPAALPVGARAGGAAFLDFLAGPVAGAAFARYGFSAVTGARTAP
ncbi:MAG: Molybdate-binding protein ModA [Steroidobacteraceae bacterium]|nr:Molybdate-binding protein ModA [Steroidobacteraceae bacterium]